MQAPAQRLSHQRVGIASAACHAAPRQPHRWGCRCAASPSSSAFRRHHRRQVLAFAEPSTSEGPRSKDSPSSSTRGGGTATDVKPSAPAPRLSPRAIRRPASSPGKDSTDPPPGNPGPKLPPDVLFFITMLIEQGGLIGTAAVVLGLLTHTDPWGNMHWDQQHVLTGLVVALPLMALDAAMLLPDYSPQSKDSLMRLFVDPAKLQKVVEDAQKPAAPGDATAASSEGAAVTSSESTARVGVVVSDGSEAVSGGDSSISEDGATAGAALELAVAAVSTDGSEPSSRVHSSSDGSSSVRSASGAGAGPSGRAAAAAPVSGVPAWLLRTQVAMHLYQERAIMENPGARLSVPRELLIVAVATLTNEMLYRGVVLTAVARWLADRLYEAGMDDMMWAGVWPLGPEGLPTTDAAKWLTLALLAAFGVAAFANQAVTSMKRVQVFEKTEMNKLQESMAAANKPPPRKTLPGWETPMPTAAGREAPKKAPAPSAAATKERKLLAKELTQQLAHSVGVQSAFATAVEGFRDVSQVLCSGVAFVATGNLLAPVAGSLVVHTLFSMWQRVGLERTMKKRNAIVLKMKQKMLQRQQQRAKVVSTPAAMASADTDEPSAPPMPSADHDHGIDDASPEAGQAEEEEEKAARGAAPASEPGDGEQQRND